VGLERIIPKYLHFKRTDGTTNEGLEPITFVLAYLTIFRKYL